MEKETEVTSSAEEPEDKEPEPEQPKEIQVFDTSELKASIEEIQKEAEKKKVRGGIRLIRALDPPLFEITAEDFEPTEELITEIDSDIRSKEILRLGETGPCYCCFGKGYLYHSIYLCSDCLIKFENAVQNGETVICNGRYYSSNCSACVINRIFKYISADVIAGFQPFDYTVDQITEYIQRGNKNIALDRLKNTDIRLMKYIDGCLDNFLEWIWEQGDIFQLIAEDAIKLMKKYEYRSRYIAFVISLIGCHQTIKVDRGYINLEDVESYDLRCLAMSASQAALFLSEFGWTTKELYLIKLLTFFHTGDSDLPVSFTEKRLANGYWSLLQCIVNESKMKSFKELLSLGESYQARLEKEPVISSVESQVDRWVERKRDWTQFLLQVPRMDDYYGIENFVAFLNKSYFDCYDIAWNLLSDYFTIHDTRLIIESNLEKLHAFVCSVTFFEKDDDDKEKFDDMGIHIIKKKLLGLREIVDRGGMGFRKLIRTLQLLLLTDPVPELCKRMCYSSPVFLRKIFHQCLAMVTKIDISIVRCLIPYEGINGLKPNMPIAAHNINLTYFFILVRDIVDFFSNNTFCHLINVKFWIGEK